jgi:hypothetical protein
MSLRSFSESGPGGSPGLVSATPRPPSDSHNGREHGYRVLTLVQFARHLSALVPRSHGTAHKSHAPGDVLMSPAPRPAPTPGSGAGPSRRRRSRAPSDTWCGRTRREASGSRHSERGPDLSGRPRRLLSTPEAAPCDRRCQGIGSGGDYEAGDGSSLLRGMFQCSPSPGRSTAADVSPLARRAHALPGIEQHSGLPQGGIGIFCNQNLFLHANDSCCGLNVNMSLDSFVYRERQLSTGGPKATEMPTREGQRDQAGRGIA